MLYSPQVAENNNMRKIIKNTNKCKQRANTDVNYCLYIMHFSWTKTPFPGQSECFVAVLLTWLYLIRIDDASYLNGYCSLMFLCMFFNVFYKSEKHVFYVFYLQSNVFNIYDLIVCAVEKIHILYSKMCYFWTTKVEMIKFTPIMSNCVQNNLWKFRKRISKHTEN